MSRQNRFINKFPILIVIALNGFQGAAEFMKVFENSAAYLLTMPPTWTAIIGLEDRFLKIVC